MKLKRIFLLTVISVFSLSMKNDCQAQSSSGLEQAKKEIAAVNAVFYTAFVKNDSTIFINCYADDACMIPPNSRPLFGKAKLAMVFRAGYNSGVRNGKLTTLNIYGDGVDYVTEQGIAQIFDGAGKEIDEANYLVLWKKTPQGWKMYRDMFSSDKRVQK